MRVICVAICVAGIVSSAPPAQAAPVPAFSIASYCSEVSDAVGGSYQIEEMCRTMEQTAKRNVERQSVPDRVMRYCTDVARAVGGSYQILETCIEQETAAASRMR